MKILGRNWSPLLMGVLFGITTVLFIRLPISQTNDATLGESIFGNTEHQKEKSEKLNQKATGKNTTGLVQN